MYLGIWRFQVYSVYLGWAHIVYLGNFAGGAQSDGHAQSYFGLLLPARRAHFFDLRQRLNALAGVGHLVVGINGTARIIQQEAIRLPVLSVTATALDVSRCCSALAASAEVGSWRTVACWPSSKVVRRTILPFGNSSASWCVAFIFMLICLKIAVL